MPRNSPNRASGCVYAVTLLLAFFFLLPAVVVFAQEEYGERGEHDFLFSDEISEDASGEDAEEEEESRRPNEDFWISIGGETSMYSYLGFAYGGSFAIGYGSGSSVGLKATLYFSEEGIDTLEINFILRFYFFGSNAYSGPFIQIMGGPAIFNRTENFSIPADSGIISAGLSLGWRLVAFNRVYLEPSVRGGYPYLLGAGLSAGVRF